MQCICASCGREYDDAGEPEATSCMVDGIGRCARCEQRMLWIDSSYPYSRFGRAAEPLEFEGDGARWRIPRAHRD